MFAHTPALMIQLIIERMGIFIKYAKGNAGAMLPFFLFLKGNDSIILKKIPISSGNPGSFTCFYSVILPTYSMFISVFDIFRYDKIASAEETI